MCPGNELLRVLREPHGARGGRSAAAWLAPCFVIALAVRPAPAQASGPTTPAQRIEECLKEARCDPDGETSARAARRIASLGPVAIPPLCDVLERHQAARLADGEGRSKTEIEAVLGALGALDTGAIRREIGFLLARRNDAVARATAVLVLAAAGNGSDLELMLEVALPALDPDGQPIPFEEQLLEACVRLMERDRGTWSFARRLLPAAKPAAQLALVRAASRAKGPDALAFLGWCIGSLPDRRLEVLGELQRASLTVLPPGDEELTTLLRRLLEESDAQVVAQAALLCGRFEDGNATERLIELLAHTSSGVRSNALWSLQRISGLGLREDASRWTVWYEEERGWWADHFETTAAALGSRDPVDVTRALLELGRRRLHRDLIGIEIGRLLEHPDHEIVRLAAATLASVRTRASLQALLGALDGATPELRVPLERAFRCAAGRDAPEDPARWREWLAGFAPHE